MIEEKDMGLAFFLPVGEKVDVVFICNLFYEIPRQKVLHKLPQVFSNDGIVEESDFPLDEP